MTAISTRISHFLFRGVPVSPLAGFRILFGLLMIFGTSRFLLKGWVEQLYIQPAFHFTYYGFDWIRPLPGNWMYLPFVIMLIAAVGIALGLFYRASAVVFALLFTYVELIDKTYYLNHYYFVSLVAFLLIFLPANAAYSLDAKRDPSIRRAEVPAWTIYIIQFQLAVVYFFAGIAKINADWLLEAQPLRTWLQAFRDVPVAGDLFAQKATAYVFSWTGCLYDLTIPFFLLMRKTRVIAYVAVVAFHLLTWALFPIGVFPWVMIFSTLIFFPAGFHDAWLRFVPFLHSATNTITEYRAKKSVIGILAIYVLIQLAVPMRSLLYPGELFWNEEGFRFSWRVMLMDKDATATFFVVDRKTRKSIEIRNPEYLSSAQEKEMSTQPDMILQYARYLGEKFADTLIGDGNYAVHLRNPRVEAEIFANLNGRPHQLFVSRKHDLTKLPYNLGHREWLEPFQP